MGTTAHPDQQPAPTGSPTLVTSSSGISLLPPLLLQGDSLAGIVSGHFSLPQTFKAALNPRRNKAGLCFLKNHGVQEGALLHSLTAELCPTAAPLPAPSRELTSRNVAQLFAFKGGKPPMSQRDIHKTHGTHSAHALREGNCWNVSAHMHVAGFYAI